MPDFWRFWMNTGEKGKPQAARAATISGVISSQRSGARSPRDRAERRQCPGAGELGFCVLGGRALAWEDCAGAVQSSADGPAGAGLGDGGRMGPAAGG